MAGAFALFSHQTVIPSLGFPVYDRIAGLKLIARSHSALYENASIPNFPAVSEADQTYLQADQPEGVPPLELTGERTLPDVPEENYWYRRHVAVYEWIAERCAGLRVVDLACGEGYGSDLLAGRAAEVIGVDANPEAFEHARARYRRPNLSFQRGLVEDFDEEVDAVVFLQTIEHIHEPDKLLERIARDRPCRLHLDPEPPHPRAAGRREVRQPLASARVRRGPVPRAARAAFPERRAARPLPRPQASSARARDPGRLGPVHPALHITKPFYDRFIPAISAQ